MMALVFDTETTGLIENKLLKLEQLPEVIEFYGVLVNLKTGKIKREEHHLIKPSRPLSDVPEGKGKKTITQITGITNEMLEDKQPFRVHAGALFSFLEGAPVIIAQNAGFDRDIMDIEARRLDTKIEWPPTICSIEQTIHLKGFRLNLGALHELLVGKSFAGAHRAKADVEALVRCCMVLHDRGDL